MPQRESVLFMGHGSKDADSVSQTMDMVSNVEQSLGLPFTPGFLELSKPLLFPELVRQIDRGVRRFLCFPNMLLPGRHTMEHLPGVIGWAQRHFPDVEFYYGNFIGNHPLISEILRANLDRGLDQFDRDARPENTGVVVVGRGSTSRRSNRTFLKRVRRFQRENQLPHVGYCYVSLAEPPIPSTLKTMIRTHRFRNLLVLPFFLFDGVLLKRIRSMVDDVQHQFPQVELRMGPYLSQDDKLRDIVTGRIRDLADQSRSHRPNDFTKLSSNAGHHLHHLDVFGDEPAADYLDDLPGCPEHHHPARAMKSYSHEHGKADHR